MLQLADLINTFDMLFNYFQNTPRFPQQNKTSNESYIAKEAQALKGVEGAVTESVKARINLKSDIEDTINPIRVEQKEHRRILDILKNRLNQEKPATPITEQFECKGQICQIIMDPDGSYRDYINNQPIDNFLAWAISQKK